MVPRTRDRLRQTHGLHGQRRRLAGEPLVDEHRDVFGMIDRHQRHVIDEVRFPQLGADAHVVGAVARDELIAADPHPVLGLRDAGGVLRIDPQPERRSPEEVGHEPHPRPIVCKHPGARALEPLLRHDRLIDAGIELGLRHAVRPDDPRHIDARACPQSHMHRRSGDRLLLDEAAGSHFHFPADAERVHALVAGGSLRARPDNLMVISARAAAVEPHGLARRQPDEIELTVAGQIDGAPDFGVDFAGKPCERVVLTGQPDAGARGARRQDIDRAAVVEVGKDEAAPRPE